MAEPVKNYPGVFAPGTIFDEYPFLLPNLVSTAVVLFGLFVGVFFLEETHEQKKDRHDPGLEIGAWILETCFGRRNDPPAYSKLAEASLEETTYLMDDDQSEPPDYLSSGRNSHEDAQVLRDAEAAVNKPSGRAFTPQVMLNVVAYGILA